MNSPENFTAQSVSALLGASPLRVEMLEECSSTNLLLKQRAAQGEAEGLVLITRRQSAGRGRLGRSFFSPDGTGLYMSLLLRPRLASEDTVLLTTMAAVAAAGAIEELTGRGAGIKWVNDIYLDGLKVCGILAEASMSLERGVDWAVVGIGVNVTPPEEGFPTDIQGVAGALFPHAEAPNDARSRLAAGILSRFMALYEALPTRGYYEEYRRRLTVLGQKVNVHSPTQIWPARVLDLDRDFRLLVRGDDGHEEWLSTGEISVRLR